jgi:hypothetical protein
LFVPRIVHFAGRRAEVGPSEAAPAWAVIMSAASDNVAAIAKVRTGVRNLSMTRSSSNVGQTYYDGIIPLRQAPKH